MSQDLAKVNDAEVVPYNDGSALPILRAPEEVIQEAQRAAKALQNVISQKPKVVKFNGKQYLEFEDWQMLGKFYRITAKVTSTNFVQFGDVQGFEASAVAVLIDTGMEISSADAMCLNDEQNWGMRPVYEWQDGANGKREKIQVGEVPVPLFQLRSMAQTRACSKALNNVLRWVAVLAGYQPAAAEEITGNEIENSPPPVQEPQRKSEPPQQQSGNVITEPQAKRLYAIRKGAGVSDEAMADYLFREFNIENDREILKKDYERICKWAQGGGR